MIIKEAKFKQVKKLVKERVSDQVYGCDECQEEIKDWPNEPNRLDMTVFYSGNQSTHMHFCSWQCVIAKLPKIKTDYFLSLPHVMFDTQGKKSASELIKILKRLKK